jgi:hypothetical protein
MDTYDASDQSQERLRALLDRNRNGLLTEQEKAELEEMSHPAHFFTLIKARAMKALKDREAAAPPHGDQPRAELL